MMMIRKQILLPSWLNSIISFRAKKLDLSEGAVLRLLSCYGLLSCFQWMGYEPEKDVIKRAKLIAELLKHDQKVVTEELRLFLDDVYFETRRLAEKYIADLPKAGNGKK